MLEADAANPPPATRRRPLAPFIILGVSLLATAGIALYVGKAASDKDRAHFEHLADRTQSGIVARIDTCISLLLGGTGLFAASDRVTADEFHRYAQQLSLEERFPGALGIGVSLRIPAAFKERILRELHAQPELRDLEINPPDPRPEYHAIIYLEPLNEPNRRAIGYDMFTDPVRREAMERARDNAGPALSGRVTLVQDEVAPQPGFLIYVPVYHGGPVPLGIDDRRNMLAGFVYSPFRATDLISAAVSRQSGSGVAYEVYDGPEVSPQALLYRSDAPNGPSSTDAPRFAKRADVNIAGRRWTLRFRTTPAFESTSSREFTLLVVGLGVIVSVVLFTITQGQASARMRAERAADELRASQAALRASESRFRRLADANLVGVAFASTTGQMREANDAMLAILGCTREQLDAGLARWDAVTPIELRAADDRAIEQLRATGVCTPYEKQFIRPDGTRVPVLLGIALLEGTADETVGICVDLTERNRAIEDLKTARDLANAARAEAEEASRLKDEFLATVSHELRTPLNAILGWAQILRKAPHEPDDLEQGIATIERNAKAQAQLVDDLLDVSRIVAGKLRLELKPLDLPHVIDAAIEAVRPGANAKGVNLSRVFDPHVGPVWGDADRLQQVVWNLLSNAVKFTPRGGSVQVLLQPRDGNAEIAVSDTGRGISREFLPHVFDRFRQADASITRQFGGLGLGLGIVRHLVELHGGTVAASSLGENKGATFVVTLPLAEVEPKLADDRTAHHRAHAADSDAPQELRGVRCLVVEDDEDSRWLLERLLRDAGAEVTSAASAAEGFDAFMRQRPDVLVSDIGMPIEDGYSLLRRIRAASGNGDCAVPAIALTALARAEDRHRALLAGYQVHLAKPVEPAALRDAIVRLVERGSVSG
jgi:PAS domain S-box-containing protein